MTDDTRPGDNGVPAVPASTDALVTKASPLFIDSSPDRVIPRGRIVAWALWDWGGAAFNAVITTFVFTVYLTGSLFVSPALATARDAETDVHGPAHAAVTAAEAPLSSGLGWGLAIAGIVVALLAPVLGQRTDGSGRRKLWLGINTGVVVLITALMFFVKGEPGYFLFGVALVAIGTIFYEIATVNYNAMLVQVSTPKTVGKVSGFGWGAGYLGGIVLLLIVYFGLVVESSSAPGTGGLLHVTEADGLNIRIIALIAAAWTLIFSLPVLFAVPEIPANRRVVRVGFFQSYAVLVRDVGRLWKESRNTVLFLIASAFFRDGLVGVFTFGGILAAGDVRLLERPGHHLRDRRQRRRRCQHDHLGTFRRPVRRQAGDRDLACRPHRRRSRRLLRPRPRRDRVLDRRPRALPVRRPGAVVQPHVPRAPDPGRPRGRSVRPLRDDRSRRQLPGAAALRHLRRRRRRTVLGHPRASCSCWRSVWRCSSR